VGPQSSAGSVPRGHERGHEGSATVQQAATGRFAGVATGAPGPDHPAGVDGGADDGADSGGSRRWRKVLVQVLWPGLILVGVVALVEYRPWTDMVFVGELRAGDCFDDPETDGDWITEVRGVRCEQPHDNEVFALAELADMPETYPTQRRLAGASDDLCAEHLEEYVGTPLSETDLEVMGMYPDPEGWSNGDRQVICFLFYADLDKLEVAMKGHESLHESPSSRAPGAPDTSSFST
jgi:hypothetical protein